MLDDILPSQMRAARALIGWTREDLANASSVTVRHLARIEVGEIAPRARTLAAIRAALEAAGVEFTNGEQPGVRLRSLRGNKGQSGKEIS
jgi:transcriptional regulator with XRE-family HTH domain